MALSNNSIYARLNEFATLLDAGLPLEKALNSLRLPKSSSQSITKVFSALRKKQPLSQALCHLLPLSKSDQIKLDIAHNSGQISTVLRELSAQYEARESRLKQLKAKLWLSIAVVIIATIAGTLKKSVQYPELIGSHIVQAMILLAIVAGVTKLLFIGVQRDTAFWLNQFWKIGLHRASKRLNQAFEYFFFSAVMWQIKAGIDVQSAVKKMKGLIQHANYNTMVEDCVNMLGKGLSMTTAFSDSGLARSNHLLQVLNTAEVSGTYSESLTGFLALQKGDLDLALHHLYQWLPRFYYAVAILIGFAMVL